jgi:hypothetical protein
MRQADDFALLSELTKGFDETLIADLEIGADVFGRTWFGGLTEQCEDLVGKRIMLDRVDIICGSQSQIRPGFRVGQFPAPTVRRLKPSGVRPTASTGHDAGAGRETSPPRRRDRKSHAGSSRRRR